jgi:hypothetical protein
MANWAAKPLPQLIQSLRLQITPLAYPLLSKFWLLPFGFLGQQTACRLLGLVLSAGVVVLMYLISRKFAVEPGSSRVFVPLAPVVVLTTPMLVRILGTNRAYGLSSLALAGLIFCVLSFIRDGGRKALLGAAGCGFLALHCHYLNLFPVLTIIAGVLMAAGRRGWRLALPLMLCVATLAVYIPSVLAAREWTIYVREGRNLAYILWPLGWLLNTGFKWLPWFAGAVWLTGLFLLARELGSAMGSRREVLKFALFIAAAFPWVSVAGMWLAGTGGMQWYYVPPLIACASCLQLAFTFPLGQARQLAWAGTGALVMANVFSASLLLQPIGQADRLAAYVSERAGLNDLVAVYPWWHGVSFGRYYRGPAPWVTVPPVADTSLIRYDLANAASQNPQLLNELLARVRSTLKSGHRVFLVGAEVNSTPLPDASVQTPPARFRRQEARWDSAVVELLQKHSQSLESLDPDTDGTNAFETFPVYVYHGWRDQESKGQLFR